MLRSTIATDLGNSLEAIARDKVEIARAGRVLVSAETKPEVLPIFADYCDKLGAIFWPINAPNWSNDSTNLETCLDFVEQAPIAIGKIQQANWRTALAAHYAFAIAQGTAPEIPTNINFQVPGRLEVVREKPRVVFDVCNNPDGAAFLIEAFSEQFPDAAGRTILVLGILSDKDYDAMTRLLAPLARVVIATQSQSPRAAHAVSIAALARPFCSHVETIVPIAAAVERALELANEEDTILIAGSFTNIGEAINVV